MKSIKKFKVLKGFAEFFTGLTLLAFIAYLMFSFAATSGFIFDTLEKWGSTEITLDAITGDWANYAILTATISGIFQLIFIVNAFGAAKKSIKALKAAKPVQASVYVNSSKENKKMKKHAKAEVKAQAKEAKHAAKEEKQRLAEEKKEAKVADKEAKAEKKATKKTNGATSEAPVSSPRTQAIDDILSSLK